MNPNEYRWKAKIKSGHRITVPSFIVKDWELVEDDEIYVTVHKVNKELGTTVM